MKTHLLLLLLLCLLQSKASAQLTLKSFDGSRNYSIPAGMEIGLKMPTLTANDRCDCGLLSKGSLEDYWLDTITMRVREEIRIYALDENTNKKEETKYGNVENKPVTPFLAKDALSISVFPKARKNLNKIGIVFMMLSTLQGLVVGPLLSDDARGLSDKIVLGSFGVGFVLAVLPDSKTFYFKQPKDKTERLWLISEE